MKIGVLDSGVGGFSILAVLEKSFPEYQFVYLSDHKNFPYSEKTVEQLQTIGAENASTLINQGCNPIVIACNTLTVTALAHLRQTFAKTTFIGTVPAVKPAAETVPPGSHIVVLATKNTAESKYLQALIQPWETTHHWTLLGSTKLVETIENWDKQAICSELETILLPTQKQRPIDAIVLGCTHFPFVESFIIETLSQASLENEEHTENSNAMEQQVKNLVFFEPSIGITKQLARALQIVQNQEISTNAVQTPPPSYTTNPQLTFLSTDSPVSHPQNERPDLETKFSNLKKYLQDL